MSLTVVIYLPDNSGYSFAISNGKATTASQYLQLMIATLKLPDALAKKCFALWLKSPLLDVQLKPHHIPFKMVKQWPMLIERYSMASDEDKLKDEPALIFRRNAFLTLEEESPIRDESTLRILLMEARFNIQQGIYPCDEEDIEELGALMCLSIKENKKEEITSVVKENLPTLLPQHLAKPRKSFLTRQQSMEEKVLRCVKKVSNEKETVHCVVEFMKICWQLPYYGSVMFPGFVEKAHNHNWSSLFYSHNTQIPVRVAISMSGVWVIDCEKKHVLIGLLYDEFNWEITEPEPESEEVILPSLFLEFEDEKTKTNNLLQIVSRQASMMNSMIETCIVAKREKEQFAQGLNLQPHGEEANGSKPGTNPSHSSSSCRVRPLYKRQNSVTTSRLEKLNLTQIADSDENSDAESSPPHGSESHHNKPHLNKLPLFRKIGAKNKPAASSAEMHELL